MKKGFAIQVLQRFLHMRKRKEKLIFYWLILLEKLLLNAVMYELLAAIETYDFSSINAEPRKNE